MKKFLAMILATALLLCACGSNNEPAESTAPIETEPIEEAATGIENTAEFEALNDEELEYNVDYVLITVSAAESYLSYLKNSEINDLLDFLTDVEFSDDKKMEEGVTQGAYLEIGAGDEKYELEIDGIRLMYKVGDESSWLDAPRYNFIDDEHYMNDGAFEYIAKLIDSKIKEAPNIEDLGYYDLMVDSYERYKENKLSADS